jgi:hypothetical protein
LCLKAAVCSRAFSDAVGDCDGPEDPAQKESSQAAAGVLFGSLEPLVSQIATISVGLETEDDLNGFAFTMLPSGPTAPKTPQLLKP